MSNTNQTMNNSGLPLKKLYVNVAKTQPQTHHQHQRSSSDLYKNDNHGQRNNGTFTRTNRPTRSDNAHESPVMPSPTLTCGSQTPSTLSPATPYFGSFASSDGVQTQAKVSINGGTIELKGAISEQV
ncbi:hypothetical protein ONZ45_g11912 [Pleurotus djamor]|nr:hypothetical protein ONZ45_g11912 [Pleurotus djamor]